MGKQGSNVGAYLAAQATRIVQQQRAPLLMLLAALCVCAGGQSASGQTDGGSEKLRVAIMVPANPRLHPRLKSIMHDNLHAILDANPQLNMRLFVDSGPVAEHPGDLRPLSKTSRLRNRMLDSLDLDKFDYLVWIDSDVVEIPPDLPTALITANPTGVTAPLVLIEEPGPLGPNQFYDTTAFVLKGRADVAVNVTDPYVVGRSIEMFPPYIPDKKDGSELVEMDGVGTCYSIPTSIFKEGGARFQDHARLTEHFSVISKAHEMKVPVLLHMGLTVRHANLPKYGAGWHSNTKK